MVIPGLSRLTRSDARPLLLWDEYTAGDGVRGFLVAADDHSEEGDSTLYNYLRQQRRLKTLLENTRLLYVGSTRAIRRLWLTTGVTAQEEAGWKNPPGSSLLAPIWDAFRQQLVLHEAKQLDTEQRQQGGLLRRLQYLPAVPELVPSTPVEDSNIPERAMNRLERYVGTVVHLALEELSRREQLPVSPEKADRLRWGMSLRQLGLSGEDLERALAALLQSVSASLTDPQGRWLLSCRHGDAQSEYALTCASSAGRLQDLVIDRTFLDSENGTRWIVDYKTSRPREGEPTEAFLRREALVYREQLAGYREAMAARGPEPIRCALYFTALSVFHELELE